MIQHEQILNGKILIIDDEPANVMVLTETLKQGGYVCIKSITDPRQALQEFQNFKPDVVLLDLHMPHLDGYQVMEQIREVDQGQKTPIMVLTAQTGQLPLVRALEGGARDFLTKPFDIIEVSMRIKNMLEVSLLCNRVYLSNHILEQKLENRTLELAAARLKLENEMSQRRKLEEELKAITFSAEDKN